MTNAVIYARYSSAGQSEQTIDGQLRACNEYAARMGYAVIDQYIDRAKTGTNDKRPEFQRMIADAEKKQFQFVIVYMVDRFARNKYDSVIYKYELKKHGIKVVSAMEQISDTEEGYLVEGLLEMFAEQYSRKLSVRIRRSFQDSLERGSAWGGHNLIGYKIENKKHVVDEDKAPIIRYAFKQYAAGVPLKQIIDELNAKGFTTGKGKPLTISSLQKALRNPKYTGKHIINGEVYEDRFPVLIDEATFEAVQRRLDMKKRAPGLGTGKVDYLLTGKVNCGHCGAPLVGVSGTGQHGEKHYYYACANRYKNKACNKKYELKQLLEFLIVFNVRFYILIKENAEKVVKRVLKDYDKRLNTSAIKAFEGKITAINKKLDGIVKLMIDNADNDVTIGRLKAEADILTKQLEHTEAELSKMRLAVQIPHTKEDLLKYLKLFVNGLPENIEYQRRIIDRLIYKIFVYDDKILIYFNILNDMHISFDKLPDFDEMEIEPTDYDESPGSSEDSEPPDSAAAGSFFADTAPPREGELNRKEVQLTL